jgi:hydroxymethylglutaryl-CoA reductase
MKLGGDWRKLPIEGRRAFLSERLESAAAFFSSFEISNEEQKTADSLIENAVGYYPLPLGVVVGLVVDGEEYAVPVATEEASVIAAASFAARVIASSGGFTTFSTPPVMTAEVFLADGGFPAATLALLESKREELTAAASGPLAAMKARGGGLASIDFSSVPGVPFAKIEIGVDVRDAMGANLLNTCGEAVAAKLEELTGLVPLMSIVSNGASLRRARAVFTLPFAALSRAARGLDGAETAKRIAEAALVAGADRDRAVTHNKGIMNGITGLTVATGNDSRAMEAAAHAWASRNGRYQPLSTYTIEGENLRGELELPVPLATVGGGVSVNPGSAFALDLLGRPDAPLLGRVAAALGLAQNFAALLALTTEGIQRGHMRLHDRRRELPR